MEIGSRWSFITYASQPPIIRAILNRALQPHRCRRNDNAARPKTIITDGSGTR